MNVSDPSLAPPERAPDRGLPHWTLPVALVGLAILLISTLPALVARRRLERAERRLDDEVRAMDQATERIQRDRQAIQTDEYVLDRARRELFDPGARVAVRSTAVSAPPK